MRWCSLSLLAVVLAVVWPVHGQSGTEKDVELPDPWDQVYSECLSTWSLPCIQRKLLVFVDRIGRFNKFSLLGDAVTVVRIGAEPGPPITEEGLQARLLPGQDEAVGALLQHSFLSFLDSHVLRFRLPAGLSVSSGGRALGDTFEINLGRALQEARGKKKKQMMMLGAMMMAKAMMLGKMMMMIIKFKAIKALLLSVVALALAKIQLFKALKGGGGMKGGKETYIIIKGKGGGGSGGGHGGGGGGGYSSGPPSGGGGWSDGGSSGGGGGWSSGGKNIVSKVAGEAEAEGGNPTAVVVEEAEVAGPAAAAVVVVVAAVDGRVEVEAEEAAGLEEEAEAAEAVGVATMMPAG
ncbi:hypothetical protein J6590_000825 [Homalodisca vitripennis]|nr:hypothetical protein J6590_000825 [Homalodisca vitripennis]